MIHDEDKQEEPDEEKPFDTGPEFIDEPTDEDRRFGKHRDECGTEVPPPPNPARDPERHWEEDREARRQRMEEERQDREANMPPANPRKEMDREF